MGRNRALVVALGVLAALLLAVVLTRRREPSPAHRTARDDADEPLLDCAHTKTSPEKLAKDPDPRKFAAAYLCAWTRREVEGMKKTTLSPMELDDVLRPAMGPEVGAERRQAIRNRALDAYLNLPRQVTAIYDGVDFYIDSIRRLPRDLEPIFEERSSPHVLEFRAKAPGKEEEALRTVIAKVSDGSWRFVPGLAEPSAEQALQKAP
jgi:hypothetical protein